MTYDSLIVTNIPAFYKINLWNEVSKKSKIFVIFIGRGSTIRTADFTAGEMAFEHLFLSDGEFERGSIGRALRLVKHIFAIKHKKLLICGWDSLEYWICAFLSPKSKNLVLVESSEHEGAKSGIKYWIKRLFVSRISKALVSGQSQENLMRHLKFDGECMHTGGVGIFHKPKLIAIDRKFSGKFLFVGRLSPEKNISFLTMLFRDLPHFSLSIAGSGPQEDMLKADAPCNVKFLGHIPNDKMGELYESHDVLLLPSLIEPWGLVVEEAIYYGMPVVASDRVGCAHEMILAPNTGYVLALERDIWLGTVGKFLVEGIHAGLSANCYAFDFEERDMKQARAFV